MAQHYLSDIVKRVRSDLDILRQSADVDAVRREGDPIDAEVSNLKLESSAGIGISQRFANSID
jgi:hypothetical protein